MSKYMPPNVHKILTLNIHEGYVNLKNNPVILVASRHYSKMGFFNRSLADYKVGFTDGQFNLWIGLDILHKLTNANEFRLRIVALTKSKVKLMEEYSFVNVTGSRDKYRLVLGKLRTGKGFFASHNNTRFSTLDSGYFKLARKYFSGFWHQKKKTFCFNCVDDPSESIGSTFLKFRNQSFEVFSAKMYLVVC
jgi:hypothetical protein